MLATFAVGMLMETARDDPMIIAIDGPAASGKGTLGKRLAAHYRFRHLDTGLLYRAVAKAVLDAGARPEDQQAAAAAARNFDPAWIEDGSLKSDRFGSAASIVSAIPDVREALIEFQRKFARTPPGAVLDGRDIGTVIAPDAEVKIFLTASAEQRARRRCRELEGRGEQPEFEAVLADIKKRDERDANRAIAPFKAADDAHMLDTTELNADAAFAAAVALVEQVRRR